MSESVVETRRGRVRGTVEGAVRVFRGIPFAKPPVGPRRFGAPEAPEPWPGVRDAARFGPASHQASRPLAPILGILVDEESEDCLTLNVWTPAPADGARRPVMVWIHGGAWVIGSGSERTYDASHLVRRGDVVVVTINYRLGPFGFLRTRELGGGLDATGNEAMLDQVAALEWVRDEIAAFGGDPGNVTVFGESAGSVNIACLLTMPRARGLFHRAVLQSGSLNLTRPPSTALDVARQILAEVGLAPEHAHRLRDVPAKDLMAATNAVAGRSVIPPFSPVADGELIPARPFAAIAEGSARGVPLIVGTNLEEMKLYRFLDPFAGAAGRGGAAPALRLLFPGAGADGRIPRGTQRWIPTARPGERGARTPPRSRPGSPSPPTTSSGPAPSSSPSSTLATRPRSSSTSSSGKGGSPAGRRVPSTPWSCHSCSVRWRRRRSGRSRAARRRRRPSPGRCRTPGSPSCGAGGPAPPGFRSGRPTPRRAGPRWSSRIRPGLVDAPQEPERAVWDAFLG